MIYVKKYVALWIVAGFLSCCAQLTLFAMSPAVIAAKQREFRKHIATFKKLNASGKGMDPQAAEASEKAKKVINEVRPYTDVKWMEILLETEIKEKEEKSAEKKRIKKILETPVDELELSVRAHNCLKRAEIGRLADLVSLKEAELLKFRNFGKKSLTELRELVANQGLEFGMNVDQYLKDEPKSMLINN